MGHLWNLEKVHSALGCVLCTLIASTYYLIPLLLLVGFLAPAFNILPIRYSIYATALLALSFAPAWESKTLRCSWLFRSIAKYFNAEIIKDAPESNYLNKRFLALLMPHGVISFGGISAATFDSADHGPTAVANVVLHFPVLRQIFAILGVIGSDRNSIAKTLKTRNVYLYPGGVAELFLSHKDKEQLYFDQRKGCIRLAMESNVDIVVGYVFGNTSMFDIAFNKLLSKLSRLFKFSITVFWGRFFLPIPYKTKVIVAVSRPIAIPHITNPTSEEIDAVHHNIKQEIIKLFEKYKYLHAQYRHKSLVFV